MYISAPSHSDLSRIEVTYVRSNQLIGFTYLNGIFHEFYLAMIQWHRVVMVFVVT